MIFANEFIFETFEEAMEVHGDLFKILRTNGFVTYFDLDNMMNPEKSYDIPKEEYKNFGWYNLFDSKVKPYYNNKWVLILPEIVKIENNKIIK